MSDSLNFVVAARDQAKRRLHEATVQMEDHIYELKNSGWSWGRLARESGIERSSVRFFYRNSESRRGGLSEARSAV